MTGTVDGLDVVIERMRQRQLYILAIDMAIIPHDCFWPHPQHADIVFRHSGISLS